MKKNLLVFVFVLAFSTALTLAQAGGTSGVAATGSSDPSAATAQGSMGADTQNSTASTESSKSSKSAMVDDQTLQQQVHQQLSGNSSLSNVQIAVDKGTVTLSGAVSSKDDKKEANRLAKSVSGVKKVKNDLTVSSNSAMGAATPADQNTAGSISGNAGAAPAETTGQTKATMNDPSANGSGSTNGAASQPKNTHPNAGTSTVPNTTTPNSASSDMSTASPAPDASASTTTTASNSGSAWGTQSSTPSASASSAPQATSPSSTSPDSSMSSQSSTGSVATPSQQSSTPDSTASQAAGSASATPAASGSEQVKSDIQTAFRNEPTLTSTNVSVSVTDDSIQLSGSAPSAKDRDEAKRIAQSFAGNRKVVDNIQVSGSPSDMATPSSTPNTTTPQVPKK